jgi:hypothetical protein
MSNTLSGYLLKLLRRVSKVSANIVCKLDDCEKVPDSETKAHLFNVAVDVCYVHG